MVIQLRAASAAVLAFDVWIGPLSSTRTTGLAFRRGLGPKRASSFSNNAMKSVLRFVVEVCTISSRVTASSTPIIATFRACPGAATRRSAPRLAHAWAR